MEAKNTLKLYSAKNAAPLNLVGKWVNELGSVMTVDKFKNGSFSGTYESTVSGGGGSVSGTLSGVVAGDTIGFCVNWEPTYSSVTSWSGKLLATPQGDPYIYTLWQLSQGVDDAADWWQSFLAGSDTFWRQA